MTEQQALETLEKEYPDFKRSWEQELKDGHKATEILSWLESFY